MKLLKVIHNLSPDYLYKAKIKILIELSLK